MGTDELARAHKAMRFEIHLKKRKNNRSTHKRCAISGKKRKRERNVFPNVIAIFVDNRRLKVSIRLIITCSGNTVCCVEIDWFRRKDNRRELKFQTMWKEKPEEVARNE